jgi:hypothetical protein
MYGTGFPLTFVRGGQDYVRFGQTNHTLLLYILSYVNELTSDIRVSLATFSSCRLLSLTTSPGQKGLSDVYLPGDAVVNREPHP